MRAPKERFDFVHEFLSRGFDEDLHAKHSVIGQRDARGDDGGGAGRSLDRASARQGARIVFQIRNQTGRPVARQRGGFLELVRVVGPRSRGRAAGNRRGDGHVLRLKFFYRYGSDSCMEIEPKTATFGSLAPGLGDTELAAKVDARHHEWSEQLPEEPGDLWDALGELGVAHRDGFAGAQRQSERARSGASGSHGKVMGGHPFKVDQVMQRGQRTLGIFPRQIGYPLSFRGQVVGTQSSL